MENSRVLINFAILNANWRNGKNYLDSLVPFAEELFARKRYEEVNLNRICQDFVQEFSFKIPPHPMKVVLKRLVRSQKIEYCGGEIWKNNSAARETLISLRNEHEKKYQKVLDEFIKFLKSKFKENVGEEDASKALISFLEHQDANLLFFAHEDRLLPKVDYSRRMTRYFANFIQEEADSDSDVFKYIVEIATGHILASTIVNDAKQPHEEKIKKIRIYCDTSHILKLLGLDGNVQQKMIEELFEVFTATKCQLVLFKHTYEEIIHNINTAKKWLGDPHRDLKKASKTLLYFVANNFTTLEVENILNRVDGLLNEQGIEIEATEYSTDENQYNIADADLKNFIVEEYKKTNELFDETINPKLLDNDIRSINMIYRRIHGKYPTRFKDLKVVFMCANSSLAKACRAYHTQKESPSTSNFIPICVTDIFLGTYMWLQSPTQIDELAKRKLIAESSSVLRPTVNMVRKYLVEVEACFKNKKITEDDYLLLKASTVINEILVENVDTAESITDKTPPDILAKLKSQSKEEGLRHYYAEKDEHQQTRHALEEEKRVRRDFKIRKEEMVMGVLSTLFDWGIVTLLCVVVWAASDTKFKILNTVVAIIIVGASFWGFSRKHEFYENFKNKILGSAKNRIYRIFWGDL